MSLDMLHKETLLHKGLTLTVKHYYDHDHGAPWEGDGHGVVTDWLRDHEPAEGERLLTEDRFAARYYDMTATREKAKAEGWGVSAGEAQGLTPDQVLDKAIENDFRYLQEWCRDQWCYIGVEVSAYGHHESLWGIESNADEYLKEVQIELADQLLEALPDALDKDIERLQGIRDLFECPNYLAGIRCDCSYCHRKTA